MVIDKEYPATHSMSTTWFGIDEDGNVAVIDFNVNGPVPSTEPSMREQSLESLLMDVWPTVESGIRSIPFTENQCQAILKCMKEEPLQYELQETLVQIDLTQKDYFVEKFPTIVHPNYNEVRLVRLSEKYGLYFVDLWDLSQSIIDEFNENHTVIKYHPCYFDFNDEYSHENEKWEFGHNVHGWPFFLYQQPYSTDQMTERTYEPKCPLKESQLSEEARKTALRFPLKFKQSKLLQIADYFASSWSYWYDFEIDGKEYAPLTDADGKIKFFPIGFDAAPIDIDEAFTNHTAKSLNEHYSEYEINGKRGYFRHCGEYYRLGEPDLKILEDEIKTIIKMEPNKMD